MFEERLPVTIDPIRLADTGRLYSGRMPMSTMPRLADAVVQCDGEASVNLEFGRDEEGARYLHARISATVTVQCQRCLQAMQQPVDTELWLGIVRNQDAADALASHYEPLLVGSEPLYLKDLIEDELILSLPLVPMHPQSECNVDTKEISGAEQDNGQHSKRENPFAVLAGLKDKL